MCGSSVVPLEDREPDLFGSEAGDVIGIEVLVSGVDSFIEAPIGHTTSLIDLLSLADLEAKDDVSRLKRREAVRLEGGGCVGLVPVRKHFPGCHPAACEVIAEPLGSQISERYPKGVFGARAIGPGERGQSRARHDGQTFRSFTFSFDDQVESVRVVLWREVAPSPGSNQDACHRR